MALLNEIGDYEGLEDVVFETKVMKYKNAVLVPIYTRVKGLIQFLKQSEEGKLLADYEASRAHLNKVYRGKELDSKLSKMNSIYENLMVRMRKENMEPAKLVEELTKKFLIFYNILIHWREYTSVMRKGATEIRSEMQ